MPLLEEEKYLIDLWEEAGAVETTGMGITKLSWQEIESWLNIRKLKGEAPLTAWEIETVRKLSEEYVAEYFAATDKTRKPPYEFESLEDIDREALSNKLKNVLSTFKKNPDESKYEVDE